MELGGLFKDETWNANRVPFDSLAGIIWRVRQKQITSRSGKRILAMKFEGDERAVQDIVDQDNLHLNPLSRDEYAALAQTLIDEKPDMVKDVVEKGRVKKIKWFVGQMMARSADGTVEPDTAEETLKELLGLSAAKR